MQLYACAKDTQLQILQLLLSIMDKETFKTWTAEKVSEWIVDNGLPEDVARTFEDIASHHFQFALVCKLACTLPSGDFCTKWRMESVCYVLVLSNKDEDMDG